MSGRQKQMQAAASGALKYIFNPGPADNVLIITDSHSANIAHAFEKALTQQNIDVHTFHINEKDRPIKKIPQRLEAIIPGKTIVLNIFRAFPEEISFRISLIFKIKEQKGRLGHMPGITEDMMLNSVNVDFNAMKKTAESLLTNLKDSEELHITTAEGTDLRLGVKSRIFIDDVGGDCNLPCGEVYCAPLETEANGVVVFNASIGDIGKINSPLKVHLRDGKIQKFESEDSDLVKRITQLTDVDNDASVIGELGIGINPYARITGNMLEDEKAIGTAHIAFGNNADFSGGGNNHSSIHRDFLFYKPTIEVKYSNDSTRLIINAGEIISP